MTDTLSRPHAAGRTVTPAPRRRRRAGWVALGFTAPLWLYVAAFYVYPLVTNVRMSFLDYTVSSFYTGVAPFVGLGNYRSVFADSDMGQTLVNTVGFTVGSLVFQFLIGLALAVSFHRHFPLAGVLRALLLVPWLLPLVVSGTAWRWILDADNGVLNQTLMALHVTDSAIPWLASTKMALIAVTMVNIWVGIPFNMVILYGGLQAIPEQLYEAAALDGATKAQQFRRITWPMLRPVTAIVLTLGLIYTIKVFDVIMVLTQGGPAGSSQTLTTWSYQLSFHDLAFGQGAAVGNLLIVVAVVFAFAYLRGLRRSR
jgi:multiple sugar transport system permease protein